MCRYANIVIEIIILANLQLRMAMRYTVVGVVKAMASCVYVTVVPKPFAVPVFDEILATVNYNASLHFPIVGTAIYVHHFRCAIYDKSVAGRRK